MDPTGNKPVVWSPPLPLTHYVMLKELPKVESKSPIGGYNITP